MALRQHHHFRIFAVAALVLAAAAAPALAQDWAGKGRLQGTVTDAQGQPVTAATITLARGQEGNGGGPAPLTTDARGRWSVLGLAGGPWRITIAKDGFVPSEGVAQANESGPTPPINVQLRPVPQGEQQPAGTGNTGGTAGTGAPSGGDLKAWIEQGNTLLKEKNYAGARAEYERALAQIPPEKPENKEAVAAVLRGIAATYYEEDNTDQAIATLKKALEVKPDDAAITQLLVNWLVGANREEEAKTYMARLPQGTTVDPNSLLNLGIKAYNDKKLEDAAGYFDRVVREHPELPDAYYYRGLVELAQNKTEPAKKDFQKLLELAPNHAKAAEVKEYLQAL